MAGSRTPVAAQATSPSGDKKAVPNDSSDCGSGEKAVVQEKGNILPGSVDELHSMANDAARKGEEAKAARFYTMAIDGLAKGMKKDEHGNASDADIIALNKSSDGQLAKLLSNRSMMNLKQGDMAAAVEDARTCIRADVTFEKGHVRLQAALEASGAPMKQLLEVCEQGVDACPESEFLVKRKWQLKKAIAATPSSSSAPKAQDGSGPSVDDTRRIADDPKDPRRAMAAADLGSVLAVGSHGLAKDVVAAERYLRIGSEGDDVGAMRHLGLLLLELNRPAEAAQELSKAVAAGDERAKEVFAQLTSEAQIRQAEARAKLEELAAGGDQQAQAMLEELDAQ